ncbi:hypothetical protein AVEN_12610-1 [Araneus ventricosus]|uniref:Uncharacterized protein n=1 Tax=Araneus ventricosus TaxID=182803 RepID=A0A4Y2ACD8_ARAVE|nr:hypothetical protein AVEN_12610-1 [Araneus ventricosus]
MINRQVFSFLKNVLFFLIDRLYKEWEYILGNGRSYSERSSERGDLYTKQLIENIIHDRASKYDPYMLDRNAAISYRTASVVLGKAHVTGLSSLHRSNICCLTEEGNRLFINANLGAGPLTYRRQIVLRFGDFERKATVMVSLIDIKVSVDFSVEKETGRNGFLLNFAINELTGFKLSINGSGFFDWSINLFLSFWTLVLRRIVRNLLENELEQYILNRLPQYQFPVEGTSYRNETKCNDQHDGVQNNEASLSESFHMEQSHETQRWSRMSPICKSSVTDGSNSAEYGIAKDFGSNPEITKTFRCFPETNKWKTEMNDFSLPEQSLDLCSGSLNKNSCDEVSKDKAEEECNLVSDLSRKTCELSRSLNIITKKLDSINRITNSMSKEMTLKNSLNILDDCSLFGRNIPGELKDADEVEYNSSERTDSATSSLAKGFENEQSFLICERVGKIPKSKMEDSSQMSRDSDRDQVKRASVVVSENLGQSKLLEEIFSGTHERSCKNVDENSFDMEIKLPVRVDNCDSSPSTKLESSQIDENILEPSSTETGTFLNPTRNFDSERRKAQIDYLEKMFNGKKREGRTEDSSENRVSVESCNRCKSPEENISARNLDLELRGTEMFQNESLISCTVDELKKHQKVFPCGSPQEYESRIEDSESIQSYPSEMLSGSHGVKTQCISDPEDKVDGQTLFSSNIISNSMQQMIQDEKSFDLVADTETVSTSLQSSEKEVNEKIPLKCVEVHIEEELNEDSQLKPNEGYNAVNSSDSEIIFFGFPEPSFGLCSGSLQKSSCDEVSKDEGKCDPLSVNSRDSLEMSRSLKVEKENLESINHTTNSFQESCLLEELACSNESDTHCTDSMAEFSSIAGLKFNEISNENSLDETPHLKPLHDLQEETIAKARKLVPDVVLESNPEDNEYSSSFPVSSCKNLECEKEKSKCDEANRLLREDSKADLEVSSLLEGDRPSLSVTERPTLEYETSRKFTSESESETNEPKRDI